MTLISIFFAETIAAARRTRSSTNIFAYCSPHVRESEEGRRWTLCTQTNGTRGLTSRPTFTIKRADGRERVEEKRMEGGGRVDEKRRGWLSNSNLGVGRVGKWAQCGVTLRAFALSPSAPL